MLQRHTVESFAPATDLHPAAVPELRRRGDEVRVRDVVKAFWSSKWLVCATTMAFALLALAAAFALPKTYQATVVLLPVTTGPGGGLSAAGALAQLGGGLSMLAGISLPSDGRKARAVEVIQSDALTQKYIHDNDLLPVLFSDLWDPVSGRWNVKRPQDTPTLWKASEKFKHSVRAVKIDTRTGLVTLTITWKDAKAAAKWANDLVRLTNDSLRTKAVTQAERNIAYLNKAAESATAVEARQAIYSLLKNEVNEAMLARGADEYAFEVLDPASVPERPIFPNKPVFLLIGLAFGTLVSVLLVSYRADWI